ncbi:Hsp20 family protein [Robiginitomaculum antarcticum]|uniref:Hsp20 family protein n=1 Tax=Robiginitomaculum antarcticum TaxID=437507 RepID=UPI000525A76B|nr:Hsp20 family protein [Robiginitomaculum antarcticum]
MRNTYDFSPLYRSFVGFERMANMIDQASQDNSPSYPPYNIEQIDEDSYRIELAVAGFGQDELKIESHKNVLTISASREGDESDAERKFVHRGIAGRGFDRRFQLADHVIVTGADLVNGLLVIDLRRELPEAMKPRTIAIGEVAANDKKLTGKTPSGKSKAA